MAHEALKADLWVENRCVLLELLDENKDPILTQSGQQVFASGFIVDGVWDNVQGSYPPESGRCFLYTCWHVLTGYDPRDPKTPPLYVPRKYLRIHGLQVSSVVTDPLTSLGSDDLTVALYDQNNNPT